MNAKRIRIAAGVARTVCAAAALTIPGSATVSQEKTSRAETALTANLPVLDGQRLRATVLEVTYPPGGANPAHRHPCPVIGYVLEGAVRMQLKGRDEKVFRAGEAFFESPADVHVISANASQDQPARFLAYFVCDRATPLTLPATEGKEEK